MVAAFLTGVSGLVRHIKREKHANMWFLRGFDRLDAKKVEFVAVCAVASRVPEAVQADLMKDNRVALQVDSLWETAAKEVKWVVDLPEGTWAVLGDLCNRPGGWMKDMAINAAHIAFHFFHRRVLAPVAEYPWSLIHGDIAGNLDDLAAEECPDEPISRNMWLLMHRAFPKAQLIKTVDMLGHVGCTSLPAEQQHASLALLHKWHPDYDTTTLISRALLLQASKLLPIRTNAEKQAEKLSTKLQYILRAEPHRARGRHQLVAAMLQICSGKKEAGCEGYDGSMHILAKQCITRHMAMWAQQSLAQQAEWHHRARRHADARQHLLALQWQTLSSGMAKVETTIAEKKMKPAALTMSAAKMDQADIDCFDRLRKQPGFRQQQGIAMRRADVGTAPAYYAEPKAGPDSWARQEPTMPDWAHAFV